jgi:hypothetical protein
LTDSELEGLWVFYGGKPERLTESMRTSPKPVISC